MVSHSDVLCVNLDHFIALRRDLHAHPELGYDVDRTARRVAEQLTHFGCDSVVTGIGHTGVVGLIHGRNPVDMSQPCKVVGLRADMDALCMEEETNLLYRSTVPSRMHACGHDGHTTMLLGAAQHLCETRRFRGTVAVIFQPAEEGAFGARTMIEDGLMTRFGIDEVYAMHNMPGMAAGSFATRPGPMLASGDRYIVEIQGRGGHVAKPHECSDAVLAACHVVVALQSIVARSIDPLDAAVVSVSSIKAGKAFNILPQTSHLKVAVRTLTTRARDACEARLRAIVNGTAEMFGATATIDFRQGYPVTNNDIGRTQMALDVARTVAGTDNVDPATPPMMISEDFAFMLMERPGTLMFIGNGDTANLHHPAYDFNDAILAPGMQYWVALAETALMRDVA